MHLRSSLLLLSAVALFGNLAFAADNADPLRWLTQDQEDALVATCPPPPARGSSEDQSDLAAILAAQKARTPEIEAECKLDQKFTNRLFQPIYGAELTPENSPRFYALMNTTLATTRVIDSAAKEKFYRWRPYQEHPDVVHALFPVSDYSYPSGHAMGSFTLATILGAIFPAKAPAFLTRAQQIAQSRVDAGVHYPTDIAEGEALGKATAAEILATSAFAADLAAVKAELKL